MLNAKIGAVLRGGFIYTVFKNRKLNCCKNTTDISTYNAAILTRKNYADGLLHLTLELGCFIFWRVHKCVKKNGKNVRENGGRQISEEI